MKKFIVVVFLFSLTLSLFSYNISDKAKVSLITADPGDELYSVFGHSAIRIKDKAFNVDLVFNYGTFDFSTPNFYMKFAKGKLDYKIDVSSYKEFIPVYMLENRTVYEQELNIPNFYAQELARLLEINLQPENKYYRYDFLYDNCATRIRDIIEKATKGHTSFENFTVEEDRTFRDLIAPYMSHKKWSKFGTDLGLGMPVDKVADPYEYMFLPYWLMKGFAEGEFGDHDLVKEKKILYEAEEKEQKDDYWISPKLAFWLLLIVAFFSLFSKRFSKIFDVSFFFILGLIGLLVLSLWLFSDHETTHNNLNILWALPTHVVFCWFLIGHRHSKITHKYFGFTLLVATLTLIFWRVIPQDFNGAVIPLLIIIIIKSLSIVRSKKE